MGRLPPAPDRTWIADNLADLVAVGGEIPLVAAPIRRPSDDDFPDAWHGDVGSLRILSRRLLGYAGLAGFDVAIEPFEGDRTVDGVEADGTARWRHHGAAAWFAGIEQRVVQFGCATRGLEQAGEQLVGVMAHEVAHAWRHVHGVVIPDRDEEELLTDLTTIYLGFGVFTLNNTHRWRTFTEERGARQFSGWKHETAGYLPSEHMAFAFAMQLLARRTRCWETWTVLRLLEPDQRSDVRRALRELRPAERVRQRLGLDQLDDPPPVPIQASNRPPMP
jgi:hypothetical protein